MQHSTFVLLLSFAYRLYILSGDVLTDRSLKSFHVWLACLSSLALNVIPTVSSVFAYSNSISRSGCTLSRANGSSSTSYNRTPPARLHDVEYVSRNFSSQHFAFSDYSILGSRRAIALAAFYILFSPTVMTMIFVVRRKLIMRIEEAVSPYIFFLEMIHFISETNRKAASRHNCKSIFHLFLLLIQFKIKALTYQLLLPCGVSVAAVFWFCDRAQIFSSQFSERIIMVVSESDTTEIRLTKYHSVMQLFLARFTHYKLDRTPSISRNDSILLHSESKSGDHSTTKFNL